MSFSKPKSPSPTETADAQAQYNLNAAKKQQALNSFNQTTPWGNVAYVGDPNSPSGYSINTSLSPEQQQLLDLQQGTKGILGATGEQLAGNAAGLYSALPSLDPSAMTNLLSGWNQKYLQPIFDQQQSNLNSKLANQGLNPGSTGFNNAQNLLARNQGDVTTGFLTKAEPLAFSQEIQKYQLPGQTIAQLLGMSGPTSPTFQQGPQESVAAPNYMQGAQQNYQNQYQQFGDTMQGLGQLAGAAGGMSGMFGGGWGGSTGGGGGGVPGAFGYAMAGSNPFLPNGSRNPYYG